MLKYLFSFYLIPSLKIKNRKEFTVLLIDMSDSKKKVEEELREEEKAVTEAKV